MFQKGQSGNPKGKPIGSGGGGGRTPDEFKRKCQEIFEKKKLLDFVARVASGEETEIFVNSLGQKIERPCDAKDRLKAAEMIKDWGYGKSVQTVSTPDLKDLQIIVTNYSNIEDKPTV